MLTGEFLLLLCLFSFLSTTSRRWLGRISPKWPITVLCGT